MKRLLSIILITALIAPVPSIAADWRLCRDNERNGPEKRCVVDGDTLWAGGLDKSVRLETIDAPETRGNLCGGQAEASLGRQAANRLVQLLNENVATLTLNGKDRYGRNLGTLWIAGRDVGDILISEGLARRWPNGHEFWC
ncbi:thermonuclease family protein [Devosia chinhatensis]|uniref:thermonuclease family protein n=1 Tax=Devosia chinhatensis TaxID=429727 RepID=UPI000A05377E|nr:thermonuclease family protein [Devosia chinhatensis]